jgi:hypothetical protein
MHSKLQQDTDPAMWEHYYEIAISERNPDLRFQRLAEAQRAILQRARHLEDYGGSDAECQAIEDAAESLQTLKMNSLGDGVGKQLEQADVESIAKESGSDDPVSKNQRLS